MIVIHVELYNTFVIRTLFDDSFTSESPKTVSHGQNYAWIFHTFSVVEFTGMRSFGFLSFLVEV